MSAELTSAELSAMIWESINTTPAAANWNVVIGLLLQSIIVAMIVSKTFTYFNHFSKADSKILQGFIGSGTLFSVGAAIVRVVEAYKLIHQGKNDMQSLIRFLVFSEMANLLLGAIFNTSTGAYYLWRAYKMTKWTWYLLPVFITALTAQLVVSLITITYGFGMSAFSVANMTPMMHSMSVAVQFLKIWYAVSLSVDTALCMLMSVSLFKSKTRLFRNEGKLFENVLAVIWETMLPPVICLIILEISYGSTKVTTIGLDWRAIFIFVLPVLYYNAALHTLVGRYTIRKILDNNLAANGIDLLSSGARGGTTSGGAGIGTTRVLVGHPPSTEAKEHIEAGLRYKYDVESGSVVSMTDPLVKYPVSGSK